MKKTSKITAFALALTLATTSLPVQALALNAADNESAYDNSISNSYKHINEENFERVLTILNNVPEKLLLSGNEDELMQYLQSEDIFFFNSYNEAKNYFSDENHGIETRGLWEGAKCLGAIALFIGGAGATIKGVQALVKAAGGVKTLASAIMAFIRTGVKPSWVTKTPSLSEAFSALGSAILSVTGLDECTKIFD